MTKVIGPVNIDHAMFIEKVNHFQLSLKSCQDAKIAKYF